MPLLLLGRALRPNAPLPAVLLSAYLVQAGRVGVGGLGPLPLTCSGLQPLFAEALCIGTHMWTVGVCPKWDVAARRQRLAPPLAAALPAASWHNKRPSMTVQLCEGICAAVQTVQCTAQAPEQLACAAFKQVWHVNVR